jgi:6-phosphogluconolactonase
LKETGTIRNWRNFISIGYNPSAMKNLTRRNFLVSASAATLAVSLPSLAATRRQRVFVACSKTPGGILAYDWDTVSGELSAAGVAAQLARADWITLSHDRKYLFSASEVNSFNGKPTGEVASFQVHNGELHPLTARNSAGIGAVHVGLDHTGKVLICADYMGATAASFPVNEGRLGSMAWSEHYTGHGPNVDRQQTAHAHHASYSPDNRFAYMNDLGADCIHIYRLDTATAMLTSAGTYHSRPGAGPRTLHFHPNRHTAYSLNELDSTVDVLKWNKKDGSLTLVKTIDLLPADYHGPTGAADTVISKDGRSVYFSNRFNNFIFSFSADPRTGALTPIGRSDCGGKIPRSFTLDPTERWMLVGNQTSNLISVFARNPETGILAAECKSYDAASPMCILFV